MPNIITYGEWARKMGDVSSPTGPVNFRHYDNSDRSDAQHLYQKGLIKEPGAKGMPDEVVEPLALWDINPTRMSEIRTANQREKEHESVGNLLLDYPLKRSFSCLYLATFPLINSASNLFSRSS